MFEGKSILDILQIGGATMYVLLLCSVVSIAIFLERIVYYRKQSRRARISFMAEMSEALGRKELKKAGELASETTTPYARVVQAGLKMYGHSEKVVSGVMERAIVEETRGLERFTGIVGTIGNIGVYIGLLGTVLGIVRAFHDIATTSASGMSAVIEGVAEALVCTATGLFVAIPAVMFFNYFTRRIEGFDDDMQASVSELLGLMEENR
jgi:biopolymer transport protein ExbB/TolQ